MASDLEIQLKGLMIRGLAGDAASHRALLAALAAHLRAYFARRLGADAADLEDLVQETLIAVHTRRASYDLGLPFTAWAHAVARYKLIDHWRRRKHRVHASIDDYAEFLAVAAEDPTVRTDLERALEGLNARQRGLVEDVKIEGLSLAEAGDRRGMTEGAAKVGLHRAMKALSERIRGLEDR